MKKFSFVYLVDDDEIFRAIEKIYINAHPAYEKFEEFSNGKLAFDSLVSSAQNNEILPELILLDLNMPILDGWQFLDECLNVPQLSNIPVIIVSSSIDPEDLKKSKKYPMVKDFLKKPVSIGSFDKLLELATEK